MSAACIDAPTPMGDSGFRPASLPFEYVSRAEVRGIEPPGPFGATRVPDGRGAPVPTALPNRQTKRKGGDLNPRRAFTRRQFSKLHPRPTGPLPRDHGSERSRTSRPQRAHPFSRRGWGADAHRASRSSRHAHRLSPLQRPRKRRDSNPRAPRDAYRFSKPAPSPLGYAPKALPKLPSRARQTAEGGGLEPPTGVNRDRFRGGFLVQSDPFHSGW
jgi:hypothetical protein